MPLRRKIFDLWQSNVAVVKTFFTGVIFLILEQLLELEFKCPLDKIWAVLYSLAYFLIPALTWFSLSFFLEKQSFHLCRCTGGSKWSICCSCAIWKTIIPPVIWIVIILIDGRYVNCLVTGSNTGNSDSIAYFVSQMLGMLLFFTLVLIYLLTKYYPVWYCNCLCCKKEGRDYNDIDNENNLLEEGRKRIMERMEECNKELAEEMLNRNIFLQTDFQQAFSSFKKAVKAFFNRNMNIPMGPLPANRNAI